MDIRSGKRVEVPDNFLLFVSMLAAVGPFAMQVYVPAIPGMVDEFDSDINVLNSTISTFMFGNALGQMIGGPVSDQLGRKRVGLAGLTIFLLATLSIIFTPSIEFLLTARIFQALGGGLASVICMASVRDVFPPLEAGRKYAMVLIVMMIAPMLSPFIGSYLMDFGWRTIFWATFVFAVLVMTWHIFRIPETKIVEKPHIYIQEILDQFAQVITKKEGSLRPILYCLSIGFSTGVAMTLITQAAFVYMEYFEIKPKVFPFFMAINSLAIMGATYYSNQRQKVIHPHYLFKRGGWIQFTILSCLFAYLYFFEINFWVTIILFALGQSSMGLCYPNGVAVYISHYENLAGSATSVNLLFLYGAGSILGTIPALFFDGSLIPVVGVMLASSTACVLIASLIPEPDLAGSKFRKL
ncbi:MAG: multidrug effflux MFS transporter [Bacteroidota bacterium]